MQAIKDADRNDIHLVMWERRDTECSRKWSLSLKNDQELVR